MLKFTVINFGIYLLKDHFNSCNNLLKTSRKTIRNCHITEPKNSVRFVVSHWPINSLKDFKFYTWQSYNYRSYRITKFKKSHVYLSMIKTVVYVNFIPTNIYTALN